jgi:SAM-dependent methyltransferase
VNWRKGKYTIARAIQLDLTHHQEHYAAALKRRLRSGDRWLDIGCGHDIVPVWAMSAESQGQMVKSATFLVGLDLDDGMLLNPHLTYRIWGNAEALPFRDESFDLVTANMVVEHIADPVRLLQNVRRVLRPDGRFLFVTPNLLCPYLSLAHMVPDSLKRPLVRFLEKRTDEDIFTTHYRMNRTDVIARYAEEAGLIPEELNLVGSCGQFDRLGPLSWLECFWLKGMASSFQGKLQPDIIAVLRRRSSV